MLGLAEEISATKKEKTEIRKMVRKMFSYLSSWSFVSDRGLPQNRDASSFLANVYMRSIDVAMLGKGYTYFRYMDDIKIVCDDEASARKALKELVITLRPLGQFVNAGKTKIISAEKASEIEGCLDAASIELKRINSAWQSKALGPISRSFIPLKNLMCKVLEAGRYDSREFRFCIGRLETLARCMEFDVPRAFFDEITPMIITGLDRAPVATDQIWRYLRAVPLSSEHLIAVAEQVLDESKAIYNWKNYRVWLLLTQKEYRSELLLKKARLLIADRADDPTRAGASVFLGAFGDKKDRELIAEKFSSLGSVLGQRSAIIAVQELHFTNRDKNTVSVATHVKNYVRADLNGAYSALNRRGTYVEKLEPISITKYVDMERDYD